MDARSIALETRVQGLSNGILHAAIGGLHQKLWAFQNRTFEQSAEISSYRRAPKASGGRLRLQAGAYDLQAGA